MLQFGEVTGAIVRHLVTLEVSPDALDRVQLRSVGRQVFQCDPAPLALDIVAHQPGAMRVQTVPDDKEFMADCASEEL